MVDRTAIKTNQDLLPSWRPGKYSILFFKSDFCTQCLNLQKPVLNNIQTKNISIYTIDAPSAETLTKKFRIRSVPTTIVVNNQGQAKYINRGFVNEKILLEQLQQVVK